MASSTLAILCTQQPCSPAPGKTSLSGAQAPRAPSPVTGFGSLRPRSRRLRSVAAQESGRLAVAVLDGQQLLDAVLAHPDHHQQAQLATAKG